jgi:hypothetical protein
MEISSILLVAKTVNICWDILTKIFDGNDRLQKYSLSDEEIDVLRNIGEIRHKFTSIINYFVGISAHASTVHVLSNKITELLTAHESILTGSPGDRMDAEWTQVQSEVGHLGLQMKLLSNAAKISPPVSQSTRISHVIRDVDDLQGKLTQASDFCHTRQVNMLKVTFGDMAKICSNLDGNSKRIINDIAI